MLDFIRNAPEWFQLVSVGSLSTLGLYIVLLIVRTLMEARKPFNGSTKGMEISLATIATNTTEMKELMRRGFESQTKDNAELKTNLSLAMERQITRDDLMGARRRRRAK